MNGGANRLSAGTRLGPYEILSPLGVGGMGEVYRARDTRLEREVALKVLGRGLLADDTARKRFRKEAQALAKLNHSHIAQVHDFATEDGVDFLVMELVPGEALSERQARGPLSESDLLRVGRELAEGLCAAHAEGVIHCDLKPANLRLAKDGTLKILDFGLARLKRPALTGDATASIVGPETGISGTLPYMAPEQLRADPLDARTDLWGAGVVLYELATGVRPFGETVPAKLTDAILHDDPEPPAARRPELSAGLSTLILKCLEKDPARRYQAAGELKLALERLSTPGAPGAGAAPRRRPSRWWLAAAAAVLVALAGGLLVLKPWDGAGRASLPAGPLASLAVLPLDNMTGDPGQEYFADGMTEAIITELAKIRSLKVISRKSVMQFKKTDKSLPEIAKQLGVEGIVEGSVARGSGRVKITAQLIQAASDAHLWADSFDRPEADVLALQSDVARAIAGQVRAAVSADESQRLSRTRQVNPEAYDLALRAAYLGMNASGPVDVQRCLELAERAVRIDPTSAEAQVALADALTRLNDFGVRPGKEVQPLVRAAADRAIELDPKLPEARLARASSFVFEYDWEGAEREVRTAVELAPNDGAALSTLGWLQVIRGRYGDGEKSIRTAVERDPLNLTIRCVLMNTLYALRRDDEAVAAARAILDLNPNWFWANNNMSSLAFLRGRYDESLAQAVKAWKIAWPDFRLPPGMDWEAYKRWIPGELARRDGQPWRVNGLVAATYALYGDTEKAFPFLEKAIESADIWSTQLYWPEFDSLRGDPRFIAAIERSHLPVDVYRRPARLIERDTALH
jgi:serine/threonine-protein kinase